ncbi:MAG TPA: hypothetical protein VN181_10200, partial [Thermoanaerobaculia bacterium]|nr:hypothetical protein [Thermoanaerobaculia bacterium]
FARTVGGSTEVLPRDLRSVAREKGDDLPPGLVIDRQRVEIERAAAAISDGAVPPPDRSPLPIHRAEATILESFIRGQYPAETKQWAANAIGVNDLHAMILADVFADQADEQLAMPLIARLRRRSNAEADAILARLRWRQGRAAESLAALESSFLHYRTDPWPMPFLMQRTLELAENAAREDPTGEAARRLELVLRQPFAVQMFDQRRLGMRIIMLVGMNEGKCSAELLDLVRSFEPWPAWNHTVLAIRARCYEEAGDPRAAKAARDLQEHDAAEPDRL